MIVTLQMEYVSGRCIKCTNKEPLMEQLSSLRPIFSLHPLFLSLFSDQLFRLETIEDVLKSSWQPIFDNAAFVITHTIKLQQYIFICETYGPNTGHSKMHLCHVFWKDCFTLAENTHVTCFPPTFFGRGRTKQKQNINSRRYIHFHFLSNSTRSTPEKRSRWMS